MFIGLQAQKRARETGEQAVRGRGSVGGDEAADAGIVDGAKAPRGEGPAKLRVREPKVEAVEVEGEPGSAVQEGEHQAHGGISRDKAALDGDVGRQALDAGQVGEEELDSPQAEGDLLEHGAQLLHGGQPLQQARHVGALDQAEHEAVHLLMPTV